MASIGENIRKCREEKTWSQRHLADEIGVAQQHVSRWEAGKRKPDIESMKKLAAALGVTMDKLAE